jgi:hypothetical protein
MKPMLYSFPSTNIESKGHVNSEIRDFLRLLISSEREKKLDGIKKLALYANIFHLQQSLPPLIFPL